MLYDNKPSDYFSSARNDILSLLPKFSNNVLEIGCGSGQTLEMLKKTGRCSSTVGIELFEDAAEKAKSRVDLVICADAEKNGIPNDIGKFDLILLLDVLEHMLDPWSFLNKIVGHHLTKSGRVIISLPNARHFSLVIPLCFGGCFDYSERGILDKTHLRFFTKKTAEKMLHDAGLSVEELKKTSLDFSLNSGKLNAVTLGLFSGFIVSQYIFLAKNVERP